MSATAKPPRKRLRKREAIKRRARIAPYVAELRRAKVPPPTVKAAKAAMLILLGRT